MAPSVGRVPALPVDAWRLPGDAGRFSLAGAQAKTALHFSDGRWGVPRGRTPTTHILKPPIPGFPGHCENEHLCLRFVRALALNWVIGGTDARAPACRATLRA